MEQSTDSLSYLHRVISTVELDSDFILPWTKPLLSLCFLSFLLVLFPGKLLRHVQPQGGMILTHIQGSLQTRQPGMWTWMLRWITSSLKWQRENKLVFFTLLKSSLQITFTIPGFYTSDATLKPKFSRCFALTRFLELPGISQSCVLEEDWGPSKPPLDGLGWSTHTHNPPSLGRLPAYGTPWIIICEQ